MTPISTTHSKAPNGTSSILYCSGNSSVIAVAVVIAVPDKNRRCVGRKKDIAVEIAVVAVAAAAGVLAWKKSSSP